MSIASFVRGLFTSDGESNDEIERAANALVSSDIEHLTNDQASLSWPYAVAYYVNVPATAGLHNEAGANLDAAEEALTADLSVDELVQQREQLA